MTSNNPYMTFDTILVACVSLPQYPFTHAVPWKSIKVCRNSEQVCFTTHFLAHTHTHPHTPTHTHTHPCTPHSFHSPFFLTVGTKISLALNDLLSTLYNNTWDWEGRDNKWEKKNQNTFKGVLHPRPVFWMFMHFSRKVQHISNK